MTTLGDVWVEIERVWEEGRGGVGEVTSFCFERVTG